MAVHHLQIAERRGGAIQESNNMPRLEQVMGGVKRTQAEGGKKGKERLPISVEILEKMRTFWQNCATGDAEMRHLYASLGFFDLES